jgi:hypothetical protein
MIKISLFFSSIVMLTLSAVFSVYGLSFLFSGAGIGIILMGSALEIAKIVSAIVYHRYSDRLESTIKKFLIVAVSILVVINSLGIYGYLSNAYQSTKNKVSYIDSDKSIIELQKASILESLNFSKNQRQSISTQLADLLKISSNQEQRIGDSLGIRSIKTVNSLRDDVKQSQAKMDELRREQTNLLNDEKDLYSQLQEMERRLNDSRKASSDADVGPLKYLSTLFSTDMDNIVIWLIVLMIITFDPLGLILIIIGVKHTGVKKIPLKRKYTKRKPQPEPKVKRTYTKRKPELSNITDVIE